MRNELFLEVIEEVLVNNPQEEFETTALNRVIEEALQATIETKSEREIDQIARFGESVMDGGEIRAPEIINDIGQELYAEYIYTPKYLVFIGVLFLWIRSFDPETGAQLQAQQVIKRAQIERYIESLKEVSL